MQTFEDGYQYNGDWKYDQMHGYGLLTYQGVVHYDGYWQRNLRHGKGKQIFEDGDEY